MEVRLIVELKHVYRLNEDDWLTGCAVQYTAVLGTAEQYNNLKIDRTLHIAFPRVSS